MSVEAGQDMSEGDKLPDHYATVARDLLEFCGSSDGRTWVDLGCGPGGVGLALLEKLPAGIMIFVDPSPETLGRALASARERGMNTRAVAVVGSAESIPMPDESVDVVVSRGSIFFWKDRPAGVREVHRILRPGGKAVLGGGLGRTYPFWARGEFIRRRREGVRRQGPDAVRAFQEVRSRDAFRGWAEGAGLEKFEVIGEAALSEEDPNTGLGLWLVFEKEEP
jgi:SAM-dependent methyltransferase